MSTARERTAPAREAALAARAVLFVLAFAFWLALAWPFPGPGATVAWGDVGVGLLAAALVAWVMRDLVTRDFARLLDPSRYFWAVVYLAVLTAYVLRANLDVAYRVLHPALPINPGIVAVRTKLRTATARTVLANSITLTPGTLTVDMDGNGIFYVHWIDAIASEEEAATRHLVARFEWFIERVFE